ncbi:MAG: hypothetical protein HOV80_34680 [Polyangiaceae bacterium]|nr:hypothetical protein [Polyangiaceae bacterium]
MRTFAAILCCAACSPAPAPVQQPAIAPVPTVEISPHHPAAAEDSARPEVQPTPSAPPATVSSAEAPQTPDGPGEIVVGNGTLNDFMQKQYSARLMSFLRAGLQLPKLGLPEDEAAKLRALVRCDFDAKLVVTDCRTIRASNNPAFDRAVAEHLKSKKGKQAPPPPDDHPDLAPKTLTFGVACGPSCE